MIVAVSKFVLGS